MSKLFLSAIQGMNLYPFGGTTWYKIQLNFNGSNIFAMEISSRYR